MKQTLKQCYYNILAPTVIRLVCMDASSEAYRSSKEVIINSIRASGMAEDDKQVAINIFRFLLSTATRQCANPGSVASVVVNNDKVARGYSKISVDAASALSLLRAHVASL